MTAAPLLPETQIDDAASADEARAFLEHDRLGSAYALADLDGEERSRWWLARRDKEPIALVLIVDSLPFRPCFASGDPSAIGELIREGMREQRVIVSAPSAARPMIEAVYRFERVDRMLRMAVGRSAFRPQRSHRVVRLGAEQLEDVIDLYGHVSRTYFTAQRVEREIYYGVYAGATLVSAAGTHTRSARSGVAAVGNVLTRVSHRGQGLATAVTAAVTEAALVEHPDVVLNVRQDNAPAVAVYDRLGYHVHASFIEGPAARRAGWERITRTLFGANDGSGR